MITEHQMIESAKQKVLASTTWLTLTELAALANVPSADMKIQLSIWKESYTLFSVLHEGTELFSAYVFDDSTKPIEGLRQILALFATKKSDWGIACWFAGANGYLGGESPQEILRFNSELVLLAAQDELTGITHG